MNFHSLPIPAFDNRAAAVAAAQELGTSCTLTLQLPTAAQACSPGERPLGSVVRIEVGCQPATHDAPARAAQPVHRPALLTLTF
jgi:hypothetical protein